MRALLTSCWRIRVDTSRLSKGSLRLKNMSLNVVNQKTESVAEPESDVLRQSKGYPGLHEADISCSVQQRAHFLLLSDKLIYDTQ